MKDKIIQDPVHGYIEVEDMFMKIVDSVEFQRLKWIEQGSFRVLYPGARHDRFIHSLGTFYLAKKASGSFFKNIKEDIPEENWCDIEKESILKNTFLYAALLHDIGHAPFSHTCEGYFRFRESDGGVNKIDADLIDAISALPIDDSIKNEFKKSYNAMINKPSPHEIVSATILTRKVNKFLGEKYDYIDVELAARMVIGLTYRKLNEEYGIKNCLIRLLNSNTVDVDKLDYICRDTEMTGFSNVTIDIERITKGVTAVIDDGDLLPAFRKNTLSVIDNVFKAKEEQSKWVISHPTVVYEAELIKQCINEVGKSESQEGNEYINTVFTYEALDIDGVCYKDKNYKLLSDIDIISDFKNHIGNDFINEYFERNSRRKPLWKSYYEYVHMIRQTNEPQFLEKFHQFFSPLINYMENNDYFILNEKVYSLINNSDDIDDKIKKASDLLKEVCVEANVDFDLVLLEVKNKFASKISKNNIYVKFPEMFKNGLCTYNQLKVGEQDGVKNGEQEKGDINIFFYLYSKQPIDKKIFVGKLHKIMKQMRSI